MKQRIFQLVLILATAGLLFVLFSTRKVEKVSSECLDSHAQTFGCYEDYYAALVKVEGVETAFADLKERYPKYPYVESQCHAITHVIGRTAVTLYENVGEAYTNGDAYCWSGYYHGVMEGIIGDRTTEEVIASIDGICAEVDGKEKFSFDYYNCVHGLGHGVMVITQNELFDSLKLCDNLTGEWEKSSCYGGVFMENIIVDNKNHFTKYLNPDDPVYPCNAVDAQYKVPCFLMQTSYMLKVTDGFKEVFEICSTVADYDDICYQSVGRDASGQTISNVDKTRAICELGNDFTQRSNCIIGAVKDFVSYYHSDVQAKKLCASLAADLQQICLNTAEGYYKSL